MRLHPAASRIAKHSKETPASFTAFDSLLDEKGVDISAEAFKERRRTLGKIFGKLKSGGIRRLVLRRRGTGSILGLPERTG